MEPLLCYYLQNWENMEEHGKAKHSKLTTLPIYSQNTETTLLGITTKLYFIIRPRNVEKIEKIRKFDFLPYHTAANFKRM